MIRRAWMALAVAGVALAGMSEEIKSYVLVKEGADKQDVFLQEVAGFLEKAGHFYLATCEQEGARVRPIKYTFVMDNKLVFVTSSQKGMYAQLLKNPKVEISRTAIDGSAYLRYKGTAELCKDEAVKAKIVEAYPFFEKNFKENLVVFAITPEMAGIFPMKGGQAKTKVFSAGTR
ncbi:MAG: hypothetical protein GX565_18160 [Lentisphaerae bacterium]|nr:hypothetical protein [Lentisphaerota bacterium]